MEKENTNPYFTVYTKLTPKNTTDLNIKTNYKTSVRKRKKIFSKFSRQKFLSMQKSLTIKEKNGQIKVFQVDKCLLFKGHL